MTSTVKRFEGPSAWRAEQFAGSEWIDELTAQHKQELYAAAAALPEDETRWLDLSREELQLPTLQPLLDQVNRDLEQGRGFAVLRGIDVPASGMHGFSQEDWAYRVKWVSAVALGNVIAQNANGEVIGPVQAVVDADDNGIDTRGYVSNAKLRFHCDGGDAVTLMCVRQAPEGGYSSLVSLHSIHNVMAQECPEHLQTLYRGLPMFMRAEGELKQTELPRRPLFYDCGDYLLGWANLRLMELSYEASGQQMPAEDRAAMDALEEIAERPEYKLSFKLQPGDMLLTHNFICMHNRTSFVDDPDPDKSRLMLRLWYNITGGRVEAIQSPTQRAGYFTQSPYVIRH